jgi:hypothetical protein
MFNPRLGEPKMEEPNGNDHHVSENGELKNHQSRDTAPLTKDDFDMDQLNSFSVINDSAIFKE